MSRPLTPLEQRAVAPEQLARVLNEACRRLKQYENKDDPWCTASDVVSTLSLTASRLRRLAEFGGSR